MAPTFNDSLKGGVKFDRPPDPAFPPLSFARVGALPAGFPRRGFRTVGLAQKQARAGSCLPHGYAAAVEAWAREHAHAQFEASIMDWYFGGRWLEGTGQEAIDGGTFPSKGRAWADEYGLLSSARAPYVDSEVTTWRPKPEWAADRALLRTKFEPIPVDRDPILYALGVEQMCVPWCHGATAGIDQVDRTTGAELYVPNGQQWGHCRLLCAWDLDRPMPDGMGAFGSLNWWGRTGAPWGIAHPTQPASWPDGFSWISFASFFKPGFVMDVARITVPPKIKS